MKKKLAVVLVLAMALGLCACGGKSEDTDESTGTDISVVEEDNDTDADDVNDDTDEGEEDEPSEGAPVVEDGRFIDDVAVAHGDIAGCYSGIEYGEASVSIYTDMEENAAEVGNVEITDKDGNVVYSGNLIYVMDNMYEIQGQDVDFTVYTDNGTINLEMYVNGAHADYFVMTEPYIS